MADFKQALDWLNEGKEVRRKNWALNFFITCIKSLDEIIDENGDKYESSNESILACDWELYEENPNHYGIISSGDGIKLNQSNEINLQPFIDLIKKEITDHASAEILRMLKRKPKETQ